MPSVEVSASRPRAYGYLSETGDHAGICLLPLFLSCRAAVRAKTSATAARFQTDRQGKSELERAAREYLRMLSSCFIPHPRASLRSAGSRDQASQRWLKPRRRHLARFLVPWCSEPMRSARGCAAYLQSSVLDRKDTHQKSPGASMPPRPNRQVPMSVRGTAPSSMLSMGNRRIEKPSRTWRPRLQCRLSDCGWTHQSLH